MDEPSRRRLPRIPLPAKLLISYLMVMAVGAVPTFFYVRNQLQGDLLTLAEEHLREGTRRAAAGLLPYDDGTLVARTRTIASVLRQGVSLISTSGEVLFDSKSTTTGNHLTRPEVKQALGSRPIIDVAIVRRYSDSTGRDTLYAATQLVKDGAVLRLAEEVNDVVEAARALKVFARNVHAAAISVAVLLSLMSAVFFLRPLQRLTSTAQAMGAGELSARVGNQTDDEVGDAARALDQMAVDLRRRLANAGSGDALLSQLVDALPVPCVIVEPGADQRNDLIAINGPARRALRVEGISARRKVQEITQSGRFRRALEEAEADGDPEACVLYVDESVRFEALVHVLKRPGAAPLTVILGHEVFESTSTTLPPVSAIEPRAFDVVVQEARSRTQELMPAVVIKVDDTPAVLVVDVDGRLVRALAFTFEACARAIAGKSDTLGVQVHVEPTRIRLGFDAIPDGALVERVRALLAPLGGDVVIDDKGARLWLPRA